MGSREVAAHCVIHQCTPTALANWYTMHAVVAEVRLVSPRLNNYYFSLFLSHCIQVLDFHSTAVAWIAHFWMQTPARSTHWFLRAAATIPIINRVDKTRMANGALVKFEQLFIDLRVNCVIIVAISRLPKLCKLISQFSLVKQFHTKWNHSKFYTYLLHLKLGLKFCHFNWKISHFLIDKNKYK